VLDFRKIFTAWDLHIIAEKSISGRLTVTVERISPYISSLALRQPRARTTSSGGASFATLLQEMPPTREEIKSLAAYLEWRLATTFFAAMGDNYSTPLPIFMTPSAVQTPSQNSWDPLVASASQEYGVDPRLIRR